MPQYKFKALNPDGKLVRGETFAQSEAELTNILQEAKLDLLSCSQTQHFYQFRIRKLSDRDLVFMCIHFHELESAGVPLLDSVADLRDSAESDSLKALMIDVYESLKNGDLLSQAFSRHERIFDPIFIGLVKAGEKTGNFAESFRQLEEHYKWLLDLKQSLKRALIYPISMVVIMVFIIIMMMIFVVPQLTSFLESQEIPLPVYTKVLIVVSTFLLNYWLHLLIFIILFILFVKTSGNLLSGAKYIIDYIKINSPVFGKLLKKIEIARFCRFFSITYSSGMNVTESLQICQNVITNSVIRENLKFVEKSVTEGESLTRSLKATGEFPSLVIRMFRIGEEGGNLASTLQNINHFYDKEVKNTVSALIAIIQPALTVVVGMILLWITVAIFGPIYGNFNF